MSQGGKLIAIDTQISIAGLSVGMGKKSNLGSGWYQRVSVAVVNLSISLRAVTADTVAYRVTGSHFDPMVFEANQTRSACGAVIPSRFHRRRLKSTSIVQRTAEKGSSVSLVSRS